MIEKDFYKFLDYLARDFTRQLLTIEFPLFIVACRNALKHYISCGSITSFGYPISKSLGKDVFDFSHRLLKRLFGVDYLKWF